MNRGSGVLQFITQHTPMNSRVDQIYNQIVAQSNKRLELSEFSSDSKVSIMRGIFWSVAVVIYSFETLHKVFATDIANVINSRINGVPAYYVNLALQFQKGDELTVREDGLAFGYANIDESKQIITRASYTDSHSDVNLDYKLILKVATGDIDNLHAVEPDDLVLLNSYINRMKFAGTRIEVTSREGDVLIPRVSVYYSGAIPESEVYDNIESKLKEYMMNIEFDSSLYVSKVIEVIRSVDHITDVYIDDSMTPEQGVYIASYDGDGAILPLKKIARMTHTESGYLKQSSGKGVEVELPNFREAIKLIVESSNEV